MGSFAEASWKDRNENYLDETYRIRVVGTTATAVNIATGDSKQPHILYGVYLNLNPSIGSGEVVIKDGPGTATAGGVIYAVLIASAASQTYTHQASFPRGIICTGGLIVSALTITGDVNLLFKSRTIAA